MVKRKKRAEKSLISLNEQIELHEKKLKEAEEEGMEELIGYYTKEIEAKKRDLEKKKRIIKRE
jgi:hypothetical protein